MRTASHAKSAAHKRRSRLPPKPSQVLHGFPEVFVSTDAEGVASSVSLPLLIDASDLAYRLNGATQELFVRFAMDRATPASKQAEWTQGVVRDVEGLMVRLGIDLTPFPPRGLSTDARSALIWWGGPGTPDGLQRRLLKNLRIGSDLHDWLDTASKALWALRCVAQHATAEWQRATRSEPSGKNKGNGQHRTFLRYLAILFRDAFDQMPPASRPSEEGPFLRFVDAVRHHILEYDARVGVCVTDGGDDRDAIRRLRQFTPKAAAFLWYRNAARLLMDWPPLPDSRTICTPPVPASPE